jgi:excisionase family DNA binding protein
MGSNPIGAVVAELVTTINNLGPVEPAERSALRSAVARLSLVDAPPPDLTPIPRPWRVTEVARVLRCSPAHVRNLIRSGALDGYQLSHRPGSEWRVSDESVRRLLGVERAS